MLIGGHMDSVPNGGWLDGCLNVLAGAEVLRRIAEEGTPPVTVRLVDWADEEGARFGRSLFGSSAAAGSMADQDELRKLVDREGVSLPDAIGAFDVDLDRVARGARRSSTARPRTSSSTSSRARCSSRSTCRSASCSGRSASSGRASRGPARRRTPARRRWTSGATPSPGPRSSRSRSATIARETGDGAVCTSGGVTCRPGIVTSVVETAEQLLDQRHLDAAKLASMLARAQELARRFAEEERIDVAWERIWSIEPILFDETLIGLADEAIREVSGAAHRLPSGPLHDAAEVSRAGVPDRDAVRPEPARPLAHEARGHEARAPRALRRGARPARVEDARARRRARRLARCRWRPRRRRTDTEPFTRQETLMALSFGVTVLPDPPATRLVELMELGEQNGFEIGWTYDSHVPLAGVVRAAHAGDPGHLDDEVRAPRDEPRHARAHRAREPLRDDARHLRRPDGDGDRPRRLGAALHRPAAGAGRGVRAAPPDDQDLHERRGGRSGTTRSSSSSGCGRSCPRSRCGSPATARRRSPSRDGSGTA